MVESCLTTRWRGPGMLRQKQEIMAKGGLRMARVGAIPGCSLVPAAQAQAARRR